MERREVTRLKHIPQHKPFGYEYAFYGRWGALQRRYLRIFGFYGLSLHIRWQWMQRMLRELSPRVIIDIGCGIGLQSFAMARLFPEAKIIGVDTDERLISEANQVAKDTEVDIEFRKADALEAVASFPTGSVDLVACIEVLELVEGLQALLKEIHRILNPNCGTIIIHVASLPKLRPGDRNLFTIDSLSKMLQTAGFRNIRNRYTSGGLHGVLLKMQKLAGLRLRPAVVPLLLMFAKLQGISRAQSGYIGCVAKA